MKSQGKTIWEEEEVMSQCVNHEVIELESQKVKKKIREFDDSDKILNKVQLMHTYQMKNQIHFLSNIHQKTTQLY